jgi:protein SCO1
MKSEMSSSPFKLRSVRLLLICGFTALAVAGFAATQVAGRSADFHGTPYPDASPAPAFTLTDHNGGARSLADFEGAAVLLFFGFTECPDVCPLTLATLARVIESEKLSPEEVRVLLVTVDPVNDTPERLREYVAPFGASTVGMTGSAEELQAVQAAYGVYAVEMPDHGGTPTLAHTAQVFGIDSAGRLRVLIHAENGDEVVRDDLRELLRVGKDQASSAQSSGRSSLSSLMTVTPSGSQAGAPSGW